MATTQTALDAFIARKVEIEEMLARLQALSDDHFNVHPDDVHWGHVGDLALYAEQIAASRTSAFHEGEHAEYGAHGTLRRIIVEFQKAVIERYRPANPPYRVSKTAVTLRPEPNAMA